MRRGWRRSAYPFASTVTVTSSGPSQSSSKRPSMSEAVRASTPPPRRVTMATAMGPPAVSRTAPLTRTAAEATEGAASSRRRNAILFRIRMLQLSRARSEPVKGRTL